MRIHHIGEWYEANPVIGLATVYYPFNGQPIAMKQGANLYYLHRDQVGSVVLVSDASGNEVGSARYWPFGGARQTTGSLPTDRLFTGQIRDLGDDRFYFFKARYYDATIGKFVQPDTVVPDANNPQALNRYAYGLNNPLKFVDPSGHDPKDWLNQQWVDEFRTANHRDPTTEDYAWRYYSMAVATGWFKAQFGDDVNVESLQFPDPREIDFDFDRNIQEARRMGEWGHLSAQNAQAETTLFGNYVRPYGPWDYKDDPANTRNLEGFGNFHYGVVGAAAGFSRQELLRSGGLAQRLVATPFNLVRRISGDPSRYPTYGWPLGAFPYGDDPRDSAMVALGYDFYETYNSLGVTASPSSP